MIQRSHDTRSDKRSEFNKLHYNLPFFFLYLDRFQLGSKRSGAGADFPVLDLVIMTLGEGGGFGGVDEGGGFGGDGGWELEVS